MTYTRKPIEVDAFQLTRAAIANPTSWPVWLQGKRGADVDRRGSIYPVDRSPGADLALRTADGEAIINPGDWITRNVVTGELEVLSPALFTALYVQTPGAGS